MFAFFRKAELLYKVGVNASDRFDLKLQSCQMGVMLTLLLPRPHLLFWFALTILWKVVRMEGSVNYMNVVCWMQGRCMGGGIFKYR